mgnify:CR=1 FL=1
MTLMENDVQNTNIPSSANMQKSHSHRLLWIIIVLLLAFGIGATTGIYLWQHNQLVSTRKSLSDTNNKVATLEAKEKFYALPTKADFSPMCESGNNNDLIVASLTPEPIEKYQAFSIKCANNISIPARIVAFKIHDDGTRSFAFGAGTGEPFCISSKIINSDAAKAISGKTSIPICKSF